MHLVGYLYEDYHDARSLEHIYTHTHAHTKVLVYYLFIYLFCICLFEVKNSLKVIQKSKNIKILMDFI
jgi:hypothetical protein